MGHYTGIWNYWHIASLSWSEHINERAVCNAIAPEKDVDGFHIVNIGKLCLDQRSMVPATPAAVWEIIKRAGKMTNHRLLLYCSSNSFYYKYIKSI